MHNLEYDPRELYKYRGIPADTSLVPLNFTVREPGTGKIIQEAMNVLDVISIIKVQILNRFYIRLVEFNKRADRRLWDLGQQAKELLDTFSWKH